MIIVNSIGTFLLCFVTHFGYDVFPNFLTSIFFPVNESIWEHMKMLYTTFLLFGIIEYLLLKKWHIPHNNLLITIFTKALISIPIYLTLFLPIYYNFGENMIVTFIILFISIFIVNVIGYFIEKLNEINYQKPISIIFMIIVYLFMIFLTYRTPHKDLFFDTKEEKYGINDYLIPKK